MKNKKRSNRQKRNKASNRERAMRNEGLAEAVTKPAGPPLEGEALELKVAEVLCLGFRETRERAALRKRCQGAEETAIEAAIVSPRVQNAVEPVTQAFALEQTIAVICLLLCNARAALESKKPTSAQVTALKIVFETLAEKMLTRVGGNMWKESTGVLCFSDFEKSLIENLLQLVRGQRMPVAEEPEVTAVSGQNDKKGD